MKELFVVITTVDGTPQLGMLNNRGILLPAVFENTNQLGPWREAIEAMVKQTGYKAELVRFVSDETLEVFK